METNLTKVINEVKASRTIPNHAWIFDDNGNILPNIMCADVLGWLNRIKELGIELDWSQEQCEAFFKKCSHMSSENGCVNNSYNWNAAISEEICFGVDHKTVVFSVHLYGDVRGNYSDWCAIEIDDIDLSDITTQSKNIPNHDNLVADFDFFSECYDIYNYDTNQSTSVFEIDANDINYEELN